MNREIFLCALLALIPAAAAQYPSALGRSTFVTTPDGVRIHCYEKGGGPAILFVPGWTMPAEVWGHQIAFFSRNYRVVAMDPRSQGHSSQTSDGHYPAARARDIKAVVDQLKLTPVTLVGWSMAVTELVSYVDQFGNTTVARLVLVEGVVGGDFDPVATPATLKFASAFQKDRPKATSEFVRSMFRKPQPEEYLSRLIADSLQTPTDSAISLFLGAFTTDNRPALVKINRPALIVAAGDNPLAAVYRDMQQRIPGARLEVIENAGHAVFVDDPARFNVLLDTFLKQR